MLVPAVHGVGDVFSVALGVRLSPLFLQSTLFIIRPGVRRAVTLSHIRIPLCDTYILLLLSARCHPTPPYRAYVTSSLRTLALSVIRTRCDTLLHTIYISLSVSSCSCSCPCPQCYTAFHSVVLSRSLLYRVQSPLRVLLTWLYCPLDMPVVRYPISVAVDMRLQ